MATSNINVSADLGSSLGATQDVTQTYYWKELLTRAKYVLLYDKYADTAKLPQKKGKTVLMRRYAHLPIAISPLTEGIPPTGKKPTLTDITVSLKQFGDFIVLTDFVDMTTIDDIQTHFAGLLGEQAGYTVDVINRDVVTAGTVVQYSNGAARTDVASIFDGDDFDRAIRTLTNAGAQKSLKGNSGSTTVGSSPVRDAYPAITMPDVMFTVQNITGYRDASEYKGSAEGEVGRYKSIAFFESPDPSTLGAGGKKWAGGGATNSAYKNTAGVVDVYSIMIYGKHGFTVVPLNGASTKMYRKPLGSAGTADPIDQLMTNGWKNTSARLITNQNWLLRMEGAAAL